MPSEEWTQAIVQVGGGLGFVVKTESEHLVITAGHCLPQLPPCLSFSGTDERTYSRLLGRIGEEPSVWTECVFVDPVADLAVLGRPDDQELYDEARAYDALMEAVSPLPIGKLSFSRSPIAVGIPKAYCTTEDPDTWTILGHAQAESEAWLLSLEGRSFRTDSSYSRIRKQATGFNPAIALIHVRSRY